MGKQGGMGDNCYVAGYNISADVNSLGSIHGGPALLDAPAITLSGMGRLPGYRSGEIDFTSYFDDASGQAHPALKTRPTTDRIVTYCRGTTLGNAAAGLTAKQLNYDFSRGTDGALTQTVQAQSNAYGIEWGRSLTAGIRTDTGATNGSSIDTTASASFGGQAYLHVTAFSGTDVTIKIQDSADDSSWLDVAGFGFTAVTAANTQERIQLGGTATVRRYLRAVTTTSGGFTTVSFHVLVVKNTQAVTF
jgi:hypothetical protein